MVYTLVVNGVARGLTDDSLAASGDVNGAGREGQFTMSQSTKFASLLF